MKKYLVLVITLMTMTLELFASVPTQEGLLRNVSNSEIDGTFINLKFSVKLLDDSVPMEFVKLNLNIVSPKEISALQTIYSNAQMLKSQIISVKYIPNVVTAIKVEKTADRALYNSIILLLAANNPYGLKTFLEKNGASVETNAKVINEEKMALLKNYKNFLVKNKSRSDVGSPLNPEDPKQKEKAVELFKSNTFKRAENIDLAKKDNEFMWKVDWKATQVFFSNENREFRVLEHSTTDAIFKVEATNYLLFNGVNTMPKFLNIRQSSGALARVQTIAQEVKKTDKKPADLYYELKDGANQKNSSFGFLF